MTHFNAELWKIHQLCILQVLNEEKTNPARKEKENWLRYKCRDIISRELEDTMSQQNEVELKLEVRGIE